MSNGETPRENEDECVVHTHPVPPEELVRYSPERDPHSEADIPAYVHGQASDETVQHVERVKREAVLGTAYEIWDVATDKDRWWVITNPTNLYSQRHFPSLDYTLSFHIGLMMRVRSRSGEPDSDDPTPFDDVFRRIEQARRRHELATEPEDFQSVGMQLRECLISLVGALRRRTELPPELERPKDADFVSWMHVLFDALCPGRINKELRSHLKNTSKSTWPLVNWLTHDRDADETATVIALHACDTVIGNSVVLLERSRIGTTEQCSRCNSRQLRTHFDITINPDGDYYLSCASCGWAGHPEDA